MLFWLSALLKTHFHFFNVFQYITFRAILSALTAFGICLLLGPKCIRYLTALKMGQPIRDDGPSSHLAKAGTPTMGGVLMLIAISVSVLLWGNLANKFIWVVLLVTLGFGLIGCVDDYRKLAFNNSKGLSARYKYLFQSLIGLLAAVFLYVYAKSPAETELLIPYFKDAVVYIGPLFILLAYLVVVGASNAVNLTDGLDGLAIMPTVLVAGALGVFAYVVGNYAYASYLMLPYVPGVGEVVIFCAAMVGAGLGFLWFNAYPAEVFMGDVGSLGMGAALGIIAVIVRQEIVLFIMGGVFVMETLSVILQVGSYKLRKKRIFKMAPIHHHFELKGWAEPKVIVRFWILTVVFVLCGLASLKLR